MNRKILRIKTSDAKYGGNIYENYLSDYLSKNYSFEEINPVPKLKGKLKYFGVFNFLYKLYKISKDKRYNIHIRALETSLIFNNNVKNIVLAHHFDISYSNLFTKLMQFIAYRNLIRNRENIDKLIVVSEYWRGYFEKLGFKEVVKIYNPFDLKEFNIRDKEVEEFKKKYNLLDKPIIYIGNAQKKKGVDRVYEELKELDVYLITSGKPQIKLPATNLDLSFREYISLLKASSVVVTMSLFKEGWNRTAHEAMLCKTPVVGSGSGGMEELLRGGNQIVCKDFSKLREAVIKAMENPKLGEEGYNYAKDFTIERFNQEIKKVIESL